MRRIFTIILICFLSISKTYGEGVPEEYPEIDRVLESGNLIQAQDMLDPLLQSKPSDPTLALYQTEIWIRKAESLYQDGRKRSAFEFFKKAHEVWPNHSLVRSRYWELQGKNLKDSLPKSNGNYKPENNVTRGNIGQKTVFVFDPELQEISAELRQEMKKNISELQEFRKVSENARTGTRWIWICLGAFLGFVFGTITQILRR